MRAPSPPPWRGSQVEQIEENLLEAKKEVLETQAALRTIVRLLGLPPAPPFAE